VLAQEPDKMADQDFNITIRTIADTTGIKLTQQGLQAIQAAAKQGNIEAINALKQLSDAQKQVQGSATTGFTGGAVGVGTIVTLLGFAIRQVKAFEDEQDKIIQKMEEARIKAYELGLTVADALEEMNLQEAIKTEPLEASFDRLTHKAQVLKTELKLAFEAGEYEDAKKLIAALRVTEAQVDRVTSAIERKAAASKRAGEEAERAADKEARSQESFLKGAVTSTGPQVQAALRNEEAARRAAAAGDEVSAEQFRRSSEQIQRGMTGSQSEEFKQLKDEMARMNVSLQMILETFR
jgi:DNA polymerase III delta prime subunit